MIVIKKDGTREPFQEEKIIRAIRKSAERVMESVRDPEDVDYIVSLVLQSLGGREEATISDMHNAVEHALEWWNPKVAKSYRDYRNYKQDFVHILDDVYKKAQSIRYIGDRENANSDSALVPTQRSLIYSELNAQLYKKFFLNVEEREAMKDGYIYIHDRSARLDSINCCLCDVGNIMRGGFEMGNVWYNEPKTLDVAFDAGTHSDEPFMILFEQIIVDAGLVIIIFPIDEAFGHDFDEIMIALIVLGQQNQMAKPFLGASFNFFLLIRKNKLQCCFINHISTLLQLGILRRLSTTHYFAKNYSFKCVILQNYIFDNALFYKFKLFSTHYFTKYCRYQCIILQKS